MDRMDFQKAGCGLMNGPSGRMRVPINTIIPAVIIRPLRVRMIYKDSDLHRVIYFFKLAIRLD